MLSKPNWKLGKPPIKKCKQCNLKERQNKTSYCFKCYRMLGKEKRCLKEAKKKERKLKSKERKASRPSVLKKELDRVYYLKNKKLCLARSTRYYKKNVNKIKLYSKNRYTELKNSDPNFLNKMNKRSKKSYRKFQDKRLSWQKQHHKKIRIELLSFLGICECARCGFKDWRALQVDHIEGGGNEARRQGNVSTNPRQYLEVIKKNLEQYQVLCANCNWIKKYEKKESRQRTI